MKEKAKNPITYPDVHPNNPMVEVYLGFSYLKQLFRQGWLQREIPQPMCESVAEHTLGVTLLAMLLMDTEFPRLDMVKVLKMAILHDFGEIFVGDIIPGDLERRRDKIKKEKLSFERVFKNFPIREDYLNIWEEYNNGDTPESQFVQQIDKLEMALQAKVYQFHTNINLEEFLLTAEQAISDPKLKKLFTEIKSI